MLMSQRNGGTYGTQPVGNQYTFLKKVIGIRVKGTVS
jgi:hypothetical protein